MSSDVVEEVGSGPSGHLRLTAFEGLGAKDQPYHYVHEHPLSTLQIPCRADASVASRVVHSGLAQVPSDLAPFDRGSLCRDLEERTPAQYSWPQSIVQPNR